MAPAPGRNDDWNEDWLRAAGWDLPFDSLYQLWFHFGLTPDSALAERRAALAKFVQLPAWNAAPALLRAEADEFLSGRQYRGH
jgi:hypothetical protein